MITNVGDSSVWELVDGRLIRLSTDDSPAGTNALPGVPSFVVTETLGGGRVLVDVDPHRCLLICTDGLTNFVDRVAIAAALRGADVAGGLRAFVDLAISAGAPDNVTVAVLDVALA